MVGRRHVLIGLGAQMLLTTPVAAQARSDFPPVPAWKPSFIPNIEVIADRFRLYFENSYDFVMFQHTTCCAVPLDLSDDEAEQTALAILKRIIGYHPDMNPRQMNDGNVVISYNHPAANIVPLGFARTHWQEIQDQHLDGLTPGEVLMTPLGANVFDDVGKLALLGRSYMFLDALSPTPVRVERAS